MTTAIYDSLTEQEKKEVRCYGCTKEQMREAIEESLTYRYHGPVMCAMSIMSDAQEALSFHGEDYMAREDARQALNRAKWVLATYVKEERK